MSAWTPPAGSFPHPPANPTAMSAFSRTDIDLRWDDPSTLNTGPATPATRAAVTITVVGSPSTLVASTGSIAVAGPVPAGDTITIDGLVLTSVAGVPGVDEFDGTPADPATVAANVAASINAGSVGGFGVLTATQDGSTVLLEANTAGSAGDDIGVETDSGSLTVTAMSGGSDASTLTVGGQVLTAANSRTAGGMDFKVGPSNFDTAASIADALNDSANDLGFVTGAASGDVVVVSAFRDGSLGDGIALSTDTDALSLSDSQTTGGSGVPCPGKSNSAWDIIGVNIYRSETGERGPYFRVNRFPIGTQFFRDRTDVVAVENLVVRWDVDWVYKGDAPNQALWRFRVRNFPIAKADGGNKLADAPSDVEVYIDGVRAQVAQVFGQSGEIDLSTSPTWDPSTEKWIYPPVPAEDGSSAVTVSYSWRRNPLVTNLDAIAKVFYRIAAVAIDPTGTTPSGLVETPLGHCPPVAAINSERFDYIWKEAVRRNRWILEQGGERVKLFIRRVTGNPCGCVWDSRLEAYSKQPINHCLSCFGTGFLGGYEGPIDVIIGPDESDRRVTQTPNGRRLESTYEVWFGPSPMVSQRDFIVKQNGERYSIGPVRRTQVRGLVLQQSFQIGYLDSGDIRYRVPMVGLEELAWPETRYTSPEDAPCVEADPYPLGYSYQATPMMSEAAKIPDGREQRGRTPVWQLIQYGAGGGKK